MSTDATTEPMTGFLVEQTATETPFQIKPITFPVAKAQLAEVRAIAMSLTVVDENDKEGLKTVRDTRLTLKKTRVDIEKTRKSLKDEPVRYGRLVDQVAKELTDEIEPAEEYLQKIEEHWAAVAAQKKKEAEEKKRKITQARVNELAKLRHTPNIAIIGDMTDEQYAAYLAPVQVAYAAKIKAEQEAEAERQRVAAEERKKLQEQQDALRKQQEAAAAEQRQEAERQRIERDRLAAERAELDRITARQREERERVEAERLRQETLATQPSGVIPSPVAPATPPHDLVMRAPPVPPEVYNAPPPPTVNPHANDKAKLMRLAVEVADLNVPHLLSHATETLAIRAVERCAKTIKQLAEDLE